MTISIIYSFLILDKVKMLVTHLASRLCIQLPYSLVQLDLEATPLSVPESLAVAARPCPESVYNLQ